MSDYELDIEGYAHIKKKDEDMANELMNDTNMDCQRCIELLLTDSKLRAARAYFQLCNKHYKEIVRNEQTGDS
jgi:hypothetical protein